MRSHARVLEFAQLIGADAYVNGNLGTGSPREMAECCNT